MNIIENSLVQNFGANQIKGTHLEGLSGTSVFRITKLEELTEQSDNRDIIIQHYLFNKVVFGIILFSLFAKPNGNRPFGFAIFGKTWYAEHEKPKRNY